MSAFEASALAPFQTNAPSSLSVSLSASSHLATSKFKFHSKCRRVRRILSRRFYIRRRRRRRCRRRRHHHKSPPKTRKSLLDQTSEYYRRVYSPSFADLSELENTLLELLSRTARSRSYSIDSDPFLHLHQKMNKSAFFNHTLMKRRYSVPETVMRKHKLYEIQHHKSSTALEAPLPTDSTSKDESCQTEEISVPCIRSSASVGKKAAKAAKKRESVRCFRKSNSYCQYKSLSMFHKRMLARCKDTASLNFDRHQPANSSPHNLLHHDRILDSDVITNQSSPQLAHDVADHSTSGYNTINSGSAEDNSYHPQAKSAISGAPTNQTMEKRGDHTDNLFPITFHSESIYMHPYHQGYLSHKELHHISIQVVPNTETDIRDTSKADDHYKTEIKVNLNDHQPQTKPDTGESCGNTMKVTTDLRHSVPANLKSPTPASLPEIGQTEIPNSEAGTTESQTPRDRLLDDASSPNEIKTPLRKSHSRKYPLCLKQERDNVDFNSATKNSNFLTIPKHFPIIFPKENDQELYCVKVNRLSKGSNLSSSSSSNSSSSSSSSTDSPKFTDFDLKYLEDCSVPTEYYPQPLDNQKLKIQIDVADTATVSDALREILLGSKIPKLSLPPDESNRSKQPCSAGKYNSKLALSYLFQKLGNSYPARPLLKQPVFIDYSQYGPYYSNLSNDQAGQIHPQVQYNNQTYHVLSDNIIHRDKSTIKEKPVNVPITDVHDLSDSDVSIADSLEDQHQNLSKMKKLNKYQKYDDKLARGGIPSPPIEHPKSKRNYISYFLPLEEDEPKIFARMPDHLIRRLQQRRSRLSKHILCLGSLKRPSRSSKLIHKQVQTCLNTEDSLRRRRKMIVSPNVREKQDCDIDQKIANILMAGLKLQENNEDKTIEVGKKEKVSVNSCYVQTDKENTDKSEFEDETWNTNYVSSGDSAALDNNFSEITVSEEEIGKINSLNYYRSFKKSKQIYCPSKTEQEPNSDNGLLSENIQPSYSSTFSKYQKRLSEFKGQTRRNKESNIFEGVGNLNGILSSTYVPRMRRNSREKISKVKSLSKIPGPKNSQRFHQKFEVIPEEISSNSPENQEINGNISNLSIQNFADVESERDRCESSENSQDQNNNANTEQITPHETEMKSKKGRDSLCNTNEHEELVTLSKGWINFYLLKQQPGDESGTAEEFEDENVTISEIPQKYCYQIQAIPETLDYKPPKSNCILPGLNKYMYNRDNKTEKSDKSMKTSFPIIGNTTYMNGELMSNGSVPPQQKTSTCNIQMKNVDNMENMDSQQFRQNGWHESEPVTKDDAVFVEKFPSSATTFNTHLESPVEDGRTRFRNYEHPSRYQSAYNGHNNWLLTVEGSHNDNDDQTSDIQMHLRMKGNRTRGGNQHSWKFTVRGQESNTGDRRKINSLPSVNIDYKLLPSNNNETNSIISYSENNSTCSSVCSFNERKYSKRTNTSLFSRNTNKLNDFKLLPKSDDDLTITGSAITPERKPRVPKMSERDLTRMKLIKPISDTSIL